ncbi:hypothetical protein EGT07_01695 [Herbaspirillum sp. HC18]|nr:hypothetical protein EGT07_01695 [Herbaspirillum sp. HC18]
MRARYCGVKHNMGYLMRTLGRWIVINLMGMAAYLWAASVLWIRPGEKGTPGGPGDAFYWIFTLVPIMVVFAGLNVAKFIAVLREAFRNRRFVPLMVWIMVIALWTAALVFDRYKAFTVIDPAYV